MWEPVANDSNGHHFHDELIKPSRHRYANYLPLERVGFDHITDTSKRVIDILPSSISFDYEFRFDNQLIKESQGQP